MASKKYATQEHSERYYQAWFRFYLGALKEMMKVIEKSGDHDFAEDAMMALMDVEHTYELRLNPRLDDIAFDAPKRRKLGRYLEPFCQTR
jgi:hypothetical protein